MRSTRRAGAVLAVALAWPLAVQATLGERIDSVQADTQRAGATRRVALQLDGTMHQLTLPDGSVIREYADRDGVVYAVGWSTRFKPRLDRLLGAHFAAYAEAGRQAQRLRAGVRPDSVALPGDLIVESTAHLNAYVGRAYLRSRLPAGRSADAIR